PFISSPKRHTRRCHRDLVQGHGGRRGEGASAGAAGQRDDVVGRRTWSVTIPTPGVHQLLPLLKEFTTTISRFNCVVDGMRHCHLYCVIWRPWRADLMRPILECRPEAMRRRQGMVSNPLQNAIRCALTERPTWDIARKKVFAIGVLGDEALDEGECGRR